MTGPPPPPAVAKRDRIVSNSLIAPGNSGDAALAEPVSALLTDPDPVVAEAAGWALERLAETRQPAT